MLITVVSMGGLVSDLIPYWVMRCLGTGVARFHRGASLTENGISEGDQRLAAVVHHNVYLTDQVVSPYEQIREATLVTRDKPFGEIASTRGYPSYSCPDYCLHVVDAPYSDLSVVMADPVLSKGQIWVVTEDPFDQIASGRRLPEPSLFCHHWMSYSAQGTEKNIASFTLSRWNTSSGLRDTLAGTLGLLPCHCEALEPTALLSEQARARIGGYKWLLDVPGFTERYADLFGDYSEEVEKCLRS